MKKKYCAKDGKPMECCCLIHEPRVHGFIQAMLLLALREGPRHGYELLKELEGYLTQDMIPDRAVIYRMLRELETGGHTESSLEPGQGGPARKVYALTGSGESLLGDWRSIIANRVSVFKEFMKRYDRLEGKEGRSCTPSGGEKV